jgi:hypothetical protein
VIDHVEKHSEAAVMEEASLRARERSLEWRRPIGLVRQPVGLEGVDAHLRGRVHVPGRLREDRRDGARRDSMRI